MCGIAGLLAESREETKRPLLKAMCDAIEHRGPDDEGFWADEHVGLGHRRLSIIDLGGGHQPLGNEDESIQIVFNGEIYNYIELRKELVAKGHRFRTQSDTEVLVHLYEELGERMTEQLNGMFAFAIWDSKEQVLLLARDPLGKKPLYYAEDIAGLRLCFASELKALTALPGFSPSPRAEAVADFLNLGYIPDPLSIYAGVHKLAPGHTLTVTRQGARARRYWQPEFDTQGAPPFGAAVEQLQALATDAVERRMIADVPLGAFLSGGVDSGSTVALMAGKASGEVKTFTIGFSEEEFDEVEFARHIVERYKTQQYEETVTPRVEEMLDVLAWHYDEPFGDSSAIPTLYLSRMTRKGVTVALSGDGADELFAGYKSYRFVSRENRLRGLFPDPVRRGVIRPLAEAYSRAPSLGVLRGQQFLRSAAQDLGDAFYGFMSPFGIDGAEPLLAGPLRRELGGYTTRGSFRDRFARYSHLPALTQMQAVDIETYLPGDILVKVDRASMAYSLEVRCPWLDYRMADFAATLPPDYKLRDGLGKRIFKQAMEPYLPETTLTRRKKGFSVPLAAWMRTSLRGLFEERVLAEPMQAYVDLPQVRQLWSEHQTGTLDHASTLWNLLMLAQWDAVHLRKQPAAVPVAISQETGGTAG